jgi:shikimate 5-dehydrogenase
MTDAPKITGATRLYAIVGDPIAQVRSPEVFTGRFAAAGIDAVMVREGERSPLARHLRQNNPVRRFAGGA